MMAIGIATEYPLLRLGLLSHKVVLHALPFLHPKHDTTTLRSLIKDSHNADRSILGDSAEHTLQA